MPSDRSERSRERDNAGILVLPDNTLIIVPIRNAVLFPGMILPLTIGRQQSIVAAQQAVKTDHPVGILMQRDAEVEAPGPDDLSRVGTLANILRYVTLPDSSHVIVCQRLQRFRAAEMAMLRRVIAEAQMPEEVVAQANKELRRLEHMADGSAEYSLLRTYLDWLVELPWKEPEADRIEIAEARPARAAA